MTRENHIKRHKELHSKLDELFADFIRHNPTEKSYLYLPIKRLLDWAHEQSQNPTEEKQPSLN